MSVLAVALSTLVLEAYLRITGDREQALAEGVNRTNRRWIAVLASGVLEEIDDDVRRYAMRPGASAEVDEWTFRVSSHRTRGPDFPLEKPGGEKRMLCLGDSFAFGLWADEDETLIGHLARLANEAELRAGSGVVWRAINLGVPGYHSGQQLAAFEQDGLALDPDLVVLYFNTNDISAEGFFYDEELRALRSDHVPLPTWLRRRLWRSHLYGLVARLHERSFDVPSPHLDPRVPWSHVRRDNQEYTRRAIAGIARLCRERDVPLVFIDQPLLTWSGDARRASWPVLPLVEWAEGLRAELGLPGLSLLGWLRGYSDGIDRLDEGAPPDFLPDVYVADEAVQAALSEARERARLSGRPWDDLGLDERMELLASFRGELPAEPDFHLTGEGYAHIARLAFAVLVEAEVLPR